MTCSHRTKDGVATCVSAPIGDDERFEYFEFLDDTQCFEHTEGGVTLDARASFVSCSYGTYSSMHVPVLYVRVLIA